MTELPLLPLKETVVFPDSMTPLAIGQERSIRLIDDVVGADRELALVTVRSSEAEEPDWDDLYEIGTAATVHKLIRVPDGTLRVLVQGIRRIRIVERKAAEPYLIGEFEDVPDIVPDTPEVEALTRNVQGLFARIIGLVPYLPEELQLAAANVDDPSALCHLVASTLRIRTEEKHELLELANVEERLRRDRRDPQPRAGGLRARFQDPVAGPVGDGEGPARVLPAPAARGRSRRSSAKPTTSRRRSTSYGRASTS